MKPTAVTLLLGAIILVPATLRAQEDSWADRIALSGDLRLRYEVIDEEEAVRRERARYRARLALAVQASDQVKIVMELASSADNPVSRNVTFDGGFSADDVGFDLVYADWTVADDLHILAGKMKNPLFRAGGNSLIWDGDLNPEGLALTVSKGVVFANAGYFWVEERGSDDDSTLSALQAGARFALHDRSSMTVGMGYFAYSNTIGRAPFYDGSPQGNSVDAFGNYSLDYRNTEIFAEFDTRLGDLPLQVFAHATRNGEADAEDAGIAYGVVLGAARDAGQWEAAVAYHDIEADAVVGTFSDSDFGGGGTDARGLILKAKYAVSKNISLAGTWFSNAIDLSGADERDYDRLQLDVEFRFK